MGGGDHLVIKSGPYSSLPLMLPAHTIPGPKEVLAQNSHFEVKLMTRPSPSLNPSTQQGEAAPLPALLDADQLLSIHPTSFICASCSLPLVKSSKITRYRDLPSEHWEELVDAWMCHGDQKLHDHVTKQGKAGFWPNVGEGLVGGSYMLFDDEDMYSSNLHLGHDKKVCMFSFFSSYSLLFCSGKKKAGVGISTDDRCRLYFEHQCDC